MLRIKIADNQPLENVRIIQYAHKKARKLPERHPDRIKSTIQIRKGSKVNNYSQMYHAWLIIKGVRNETSADWLKESATGCTITYTFDNKQKWIQSIKF